MASREGSRKRLKVSRTEGRATPPNTASVGSSSTSAKEMAAKASTALTMPNHHEQTLKALNTDLDAMRQLITCKICDRLLYEPYNLSCGHTYCYSCLSQWLVSNRKKTCPDCRAVITQQPTPSYLVRELVLIFVSRSELLPDGETSEEHHNLARDEAKIVADDKANTDPTTGGLFKGCFSRRRARLRPIHDAGDGVDRCPSCAWELEGEVCDRCGYDPELSDPLNDISETDLSDDSSLAGFGLDGADDYFGEDDFEGDNSTIADGDIADFAEPAALRTMPGGYRHGRRALSPIELRSSDDEESEDDEDDPTMREFIVDDDQVGGATSDSGEDTDVPGVARNRGRHNRRNIVVISDDEDGTALPAAADEDSVRAVGSDSDDDEPVVRGSQRGQRARVPTRSRRELAFDTSDDEDQQSSDDDAGEHESSVAGYGGFSPLDESVGDASSQQSGYDSDNASSVYPMYHDEEDEEDDSSGSDEQNDGWDRRSETPRAARPPPQTNGAHRLGSLGQHSNRHTNPQNHYPGFFQGQPTMRTARPNPNSFEGYAAHHNPPRPGPYAQPPSYRYPGPPVHPFQLGNTLAGINYNQRHQQVRSHPNQRTVSGGSSRSSNGGGIGVQSSGSSGSSATVRGDAGHRKRALSISSDASYE